MTPIYVISDTPDAAAYAPMAEAIKGYMLSRQVLVEKLADATGNGWMGQDKQLKELRVDIAVIDLKVKELLGNKES